MNNRLSLALALAPVLMLRDWFRRFEVVGVRDLNGVLSDARRPGLISVDSSEDVLTTFP